MKTAMSKKMVPGMSLAAITLVSMLPGAGVPSAQAEPVQRWGNPCDSRDECSANPGRYAAYRDDAMVKAREYVADMNWTGGGPPDSAVVLSRVVKSTDMSGATPCNVRDTCIGGIEARKVVRVGPTGDDVAVARGVAGDRIAVTPIPK